MFQPWAGRVHSSLCLSGNVVPWTSLVMWTLSFRQCRVLDWLLMEHHCIVWIRPYDAKMQGMVVITVYCGAECSLTLSLQKASVCRAWRSGLEQGMVSVSTAGCGWIASRSHSLWAPLTAGGSCSSRQRFVLMRMKYFLWVYIVAALAEWLGQKVAEVVGEHL